MRRGGEVTAAKLAAVEADLAQAEADLAAADAEHEALLVQVAGDLAIEALTASAAEAKTRPSAEPTYIGGNPRVHRGKTVPDPSRGTGAQTGAHPPETAWLS